MSTNISTFARLTGEVADYMTFAVFYSERDGMSSTFFIKLILLHLTGLLQQVCEFLF